MSKADLALDRLIVCGAWGRPLPGRYRDKNTDCDKNAALKSS
jgi:hypothetical protein